MTTHTLKLITYLVKTIIQKILPIYKKNVARKKCLSDFTFDTNESDSEVNHK